ncbi:hypothetical protein GEMRC1_010548 [Eukaryota sp. GEM-RC1]
MYLLLLLLAVSAIAQPYMKLNVGHVYQYKVRATVELGSTVNQGHLSNFYGVFVTTVASVRGTADNAIYTMNFNLQGVSQDGESTDGRPIGQPVVFDWAATGAISNVRYDSRDASWYTEIKLASLNSLHGTMIPGDKTARLLETTTLGQHYANYRGSTQPNLLVNQKSFDSKDIVSFSDRTLDPRTVTIQAAGYSKYHAVGHLHETELNLDVLWKPVEGHPFEDQFNGDLKSRGFVRLEFLTQHSSNGELLMKHESLSEDSLMATQVPVLAEPEPLYQLHHDSLLDAAIYHMHASMNNDDDVDVDQSPLEILSLLLTASKSEDLSGLQKVADLAVAIYPSYPEIFNEIALLAKPHTPELVQAVAFVLTTASSEREQASHALVGLLHSQSSAIALIAARVAIFSECPILTKTLFERSMEADYVATFLRQASSTRNNLGRKILDFNKEWSYQKRYGGSIASIDLGAHIGASSNLNCHNPTFDYEAYARAIFDISVFGKRHPAMRGWAEYGKKGGVPLANEAVVEVFGKRIYQKSFPGVQLNCGIHDVPLAHFAPGAKFSTVIWVIIPIQLSAGANLNLNLHFQWRVCDTDLSAMMQVIPSAKVTVYGKAETNLFLIKAGAQLQSSFSVRAVPSAEASGTKCAVTLAVDFINDPLMVDLNVYLYKKSCKFKFPFKFKCKWKHRNTKSLFRWDYGARTNRVYEKIYRIA